MAKKKKKKKKSLSLVHYCLSISCTTLQAIQINDFVNGEEHGSKDLACFTTKDYISMAQVVKMTIRLRPQITAHSLSDTIKQQVRLHTPCVKPEDLDLPEIV